MADMSEHLDRFARGELSAAESRDLAQQALGDHDLFHELTSTAIARRGLAVRGRQRIAWPRIAIFTAAAAVIVGVVVLYGPRRNSEPVKPVAAISAPPVLLARNADSNPAAFRGADAGGRESRTTGSIGSIADGIAAIDLGSLDGLAKDAEVDVIRDGQVIGHVKLTMLFRDHSRGEIEGSPSIVVKDQVRVPPSAQLRATLDRISAVFARGEAEKAISIAQQASINTFDGELQGEEDLNNAGVIAELHGNQTKAGELYRRALEARPSAQDRQAIEKNLARLKGAK
jgi:hypothetical protein